MSFWRKTGQCYVIAEIGVNHNGNVDLARELIDLAVDAGADAVKFQSFRAETLVSSSARRAAYQKQNDPDGGETQFDMLKKLELSDDDFRRCQDYCNSQGIDFLSTPFDEASADFLDELGVAGFKISSGDLTNLQFLEHVAQFNRPMIVSTGMGSLSEVADACECIQSAGDPDLALLHCVSNYPADPSDCNLAAMQTMASAFGKPVGWSDHTLGEAVTLAAVAMGAPIIEKHYTLDQNMPGPDHKASLSPEAFKSLLANIRTVEAALGNGVKRRMPSEENTAEVARKSLIAAIDIAEGDRLTEDMIVRKRPGDGIEPKHLPLVVGRVAGRTIPADTVLSWTDFV